MWWVKSNNRSVNRRQRPCVQNQGELLLADTRRTGIRKRDRHRLLAMVVLLPAIILLTGTVANVALARCEKFVGLGDALSQRDAKSKAVQDAERKARAKLGPLIVRRKDVFLQFRQYRPDDPPDNPTQDQRRSRYYFYSILIEFCTVDSQHPGPAGPVSGRPALNAIPGRRSLNRVRPRSLPIIPRKGFKAPHLNRNIKPK